MSVDEWNSNAEIPGPGAEREESSELQQVDVRVVINLLNYVLRENYILRQELERERFVGEDRPLFEVTAAPPSAETDDEAAEQFSPRRDEPAARQAKIRQSPPEVRSSMSRRAVTVDHHRRVTHRRQRSETRAEYEKVASQLEALGKELRSLRMELRAARWPAPAAHDATREPSERPSEPRFQPIRSRQPYEFTFESSPHPGMWMTLRRPWFYLPLIWATLLGILALAAFLVFFN